MFLLLVCRTKCTHRPFRGLITDQNKSHRTWHRNIGHSLRLRSLCKSHASKAETGTSKMNKTHIRNPFLTRTIRIRTWSEKKRGQMASKRSVLVSVQKATTEYFVKEWYWPEWNCLKRSDYLHALAGLFHAIHYWYGSQCTDVWSSA